MQNYNRQQGGTLVGLIIGLIIGLGIALGVAMVITKTPMPFTDKSGRQKASSPTASQTADPNRPMYGNKAASKDAARDFAKEAAPANTAAPQPTSDKIVEVKADAKPAEKKTPATEPAGQAKDGAKDGAKEGAEKAENPDDKWSYFLQAGAFREANDAEAIRAKLALIGVEAKISERPSETGVLYRVRVGPFAQLDAMNRVRGKLSDNGVDAAV